MCIVITKFKTLGKWAKNSFWPFYKCKLLLPFIPGCSAFIADIHGRFIVEQSCEAVESAVGRILQFQWLVGGHGRRKVGARRDSELKNRNWMTMNCWKFWRLKPDYEWWLNNFFAILEVVNVWFDSWLIRVDRTPRRLSTLKISKRNIVDCESDFRCFWKYLTRCGRIFVERKMWTVMTLIKKIRKSFGSW